MATLTKFNVFLADLAAKQHNLGTDTLRVLLTNTLPLVTNSTKADISEIAAGNGYVTGGPQVTVQSSDQTNGVYTLKLADLVITASGGSIGPGRYIVLYNATSNRLIGWYDYGATFTLASGETLTVDYDNTNGVLSIA